MKVLFPHIRPSSGKARRRFAPSLEGFTAERLETRSLAVPIFMPSGPNWGVDVNVVGTTNPSFGYGLVNPLPSNPPTPTSDSVEVDVQNSSTLGVIDAQGRQDPSSQVIQAGEANTLIQTVTAPDGGSLINAAVADVGTLVGQFQQGDMVPPNAGTQTVAQSAFLDNGTWIQGPATWAISAPDTSHQLLVSFQLHFSASMTSGTEPVNGMAHLFLQTKEITVLMNVFGVTGIEIWENGKPTPLKSDPTAGIFNGSRAGESASYSPPGPISFLSPVPSSDFINYIDTTNLTYPVGGAAPGPSQATLTCNWSLTEEVVPAYSPPGYVLRS